jgi:alcohol dehydrogenase class IV
MSTQFTTAKCAIMGERALINSGEQIAKIGKNALIITGKHITQSGILKQLTDLLIDNSVAYSVFNDITGEPTDEMIVASVESYKKGNCDFIIGIGGGSPLDSAKACAAMSVLPGVISDYAGKEILGDFPPVVLIPTTSGTGSEVTKFTIITDTKTDVKMLLKGEALLPTLAIIDPSLSYSAPKNVTSATGIDALTHAVEAYTSKKATPVTDVFALSAIKRIFKYLPTAYEDGANKKAREEMAIAAYEAGLCINNSSVTVVHGMSRPIGALFHVPHGFSNAMLIVPCLEYAVDGCYSRFADIARAIGAADDEIDDKDAADLFLVELKKLIKAVEIPSIVEYGIDRSTFIESSDKMATDALASGSPSNTRKKLEKKDILEIYKNALI